MTETRLFTVAEAAVLIEAATGQSRFDIAKDIDRAAWTYYAKPGHGNPLEVYNDNGRRSRYRPGLYGVTLDPKITGPFEDRRVFTEYVPYLHLKVDLIEVLDALEYHTETRAKILAERDKPAPAGGDAEGSDAVSEENAAPKAPRQRSQAQDEAIINTLVGFGYDPLKLPKNPPGKRGVKAQAWDALKTHKKVFSSHKTYTTAWQRLRFNDEICDEGIPKTEA